jgi:hypothetical protein
VEADTGGEFLPFMGFSGLGVFLISCVLGRKGICLSMR